jgi:hypothetical protein
VSGQLHAPAALPPGIEPPVPIEIIIIIIIIIITAKWKDTVKQEDRMDTAGHKI